MITKNIYQQICQKNVDNNKEFVSNKIELVGYEMCE